MQLHTSLHTSQKQMSAVGPRFALTSTASLGSSPDQKSGTLCTGVVLAHSLQSRQVQRHLAARGVRTRPSRMMCAAKRRHRSSDDEVDDLDISLSTELRQRADPKYLSNVAAHLNVVWNVSSKKVPSCSQLFPLHLSLPHSALGTDCDKSVAV